MLLLFCFGCGTGIVSMGIPSISQILPGAITAGSQNVTMAIHGANFTEKSVILWNGKALTTALVDAETLLSPVASESIAAPATVQLQVQNPETKASSQMVQLQVRAAQESAVAPLTVSEASLPQATRGKAYSATLTANGGTPVYSWRLVSGQLPAGLSLAASTGVISGMPTASGNFSIDVAVSDSGSPAETATATLVLTVIVPSPLVAPPQSSASTTLTAATNLPAGSAGSAYSGVLQANGGTKPYTWAKASGSLPAGLSISSTGAITGTPTTSGTSSFTVAVKDSGSPMQTAMVTGSIMISPAALTIGASSIPAGPIGSAYSGSLTATGGVAPYTWSATGLPNGIKLSTSGVLSGIPTTSGDFSVVVTVKDSEASAQTATAALKFSITPPLLQIRTATLSGGTQGQKYAALVVGTGGVAPYTWSATGLPSGMTLSTSGVLSGTPTTSGNFSVVVSLKDSTAPVQTATVTLKLSIAAPPLSIMTSALNGGTQSQKYSALVAATGGVAPYTWSATGLPSGVTLSTSGMISGTPTVSGSFPLTVSVKDSGVTVQTAKVALTLNVAAAVSPLAITSSTLARATQSQSYSAALAATGGVTPYTWSLNSGSTLPAGLSLTAGGTISGTPTSVGSSSFNVTVTDAKSSTQTAQIVVPVGAQSLAITNSTLVSGNVGTLYSSSMSVSGGTPSYTWGVSSGSLPTGLTLAATTGVISGTPTTTGTFNFTLVVKDNSSPVQTGMASGSITIATATASTGTTWYVRQDGGTRYSSNVTIGQCDGLADASYASTGGTGVNQHCAFNDIRYLWQDTSYSTGTTFPGWGWIGSGGDTYIIRGSIADGVTWRVGANNAGATCDTNGCWGIEGNAAASGAPPPLSGTASQHTRILGENFASCRSANAKTQLRGGWGVGNVLNLSGSSYVDVACFDISDYSDCGRASQTVLCETSKDYGHVGVAFTNTSTHDTVTDVHIHGMGESGLAGPTGDGVVLDYIDVLGNAGAGWNADPGDGTTGVGSLKMTHFNIIGNGCAEEYPVVDPMPYGDCTDQSSGGYGDGFGTASINSQAPGWQVHFDQGIVAYNTQDGLDALHIAGPGSTMTVTRVLAYGNEGQQIKVGGATATVQNSVIVGNCEAMQSQQIPGFPTGFGSRLAAPCRAGNTAVLINVTPGDPAIFQNNTIYEAGAIGLEVEYATDDTGPTNTLQYNNNVFVGFYNAGASANSTPIYGNSGLSMLTNPGASWTNNATFGGRQNWQCPAEGESRAICSDPGLVDETYHPYGYGNMAPAAGSILKGSGVAIPSVTTDYTGATRSNPPTIGAYE